MVCGSKIQQFSDFPQTFPEIFIPFSLVLKVPEFVVEWKMRPEFSRVLLDETVIGWFSL